MLTTMLELVFQLCVLLALYSAAAAMTSGALRSWRSAPVRRPVLRWSRALTAAVVELSWLAERGVRRLREEPRAGLLAAGAFAAAAWGELGTPQAAAGVALLLFGWASVAVPAGSTRLQAILAKLRQWASWRP